jgi:predicted component of type VI protein secretion system
VNLNEELNIVRNLSWQPISSRLWCYHIDAKALIMKSLARIVWSEERRLGPHHFQARNRYFKDSIHFAASALWFETCGLAARELSEDTRRNGSVSVAQALGIFLDGLVFEMPECDPLPEAGETRLRLDETTVNASLAPQRHLSPLQAQ